MEKLIDLAYIVASILFIFGIKMLGKAETARKGNLLSSVGMLLAVVATLFYKEVVDYKLIFGGLYFLGLLILLLRWTGGVSRP